MAAAAVAVVKFAAAAFSSATAAVASGLTAVGVSSAAATAIATQVVTTAVTIGVTAGISYLLRPSTPSSGMTLDFKPDPKAPITGMMGYAATGGNKVFQSTWGYNNVVLSLGAALSLGPIDAITQFRADDKVVAFTGSQNEAVGFYDDDMWQKTTLGLPTDAALLPPTGLKYGSPGLSGWGSQNAAKGVAFAFWTMVLAKKPEDRNIFTQGVPDPRWIGRWMKLYDWRKDSTQVGGSGSHRENDWRTWEFTENPYVHARAWLRGHYKMNDDGTLDYSKRLAGVGVQPVTIDLPAFTEGANISDANGWKISGSWSSSDSKWDTLVSMLKAGGGAPIQNGALISALLNTPRVSTATVTRDDVVGEISVNPLTRRRERKNTIVPRYRSEAHSWEYVPAGAVTSTVYRTEDRNELRSLEIQYTYVRLPKQAAELAAYDLANLRESIKVNATLKADAMSIRAGDCITFNIPEVGLSNQKCIVLRKTMDYQSATVMVECRSETDGKHAWAMGQAANPPPSPSLSANDPSYMPPPLPVDVVVIPKPPSDGTSQPIIEVEIPVDRGDIAAVVVEFGLSNTGPWASAGPADPATGKYTLYGLNPNQQYWISVRYVANNGTISDRYVTGPHTAPGFIADTINRFPDGTAPIWNYPTFSDLPTPPLGGQTVAWVEDEEKLYEYRDGVWTKKIDGADIDPGTLTNLAFAAGIRAPGLGAVLPTLPNSAWPVGSMFVLTTDGKTYTNIGGSWQVKVDGADIVANSIVAGKFAAGAVTAEAIAAKAILASNLYIGDTSNMFPDPLFVQPETYPWWSSSWSKEPLTTESMASDYAVVNAISASVSQLLTPLIPVESGKVYFAAHDVYKENASIDGRVIVRFVHHNALTGVDSFISASTIPPSSSAGWSSISRLVTVPANANRIQIQYYRASGVSGVLKYASPVVRKASSSELVVDGAITAIKLSANSVTSDKITAGAVTANKINVTNLAAINADLGVVTAGMLRSGSGGNRTEVTTTGVKIYTNGVLTAAIGEW